MPVGPQLPPHLAKRKRSLDDAEGPNSPPRKVQAASEPRIVGPTAPPSKNPDELDVNSSSEDDYGPSLQPSKATTKPVGPTRPAHTVGPTLPPLQNPDELNIDDSSDDDQYGPSPGPSKIQLRASIPSNSTPARAAASAPPPQKKRILGPSLPPANLSEMPSHPANPPSSDSSDSEDDYGPSLPPAPGSLAETQLLQRQKQQQQEESQLSKAPAPPQRDDWMLVPPSDSDWGSRVDPTKLKNRKFQTSKGAKGSSSGGGGAGGISALWTETPEQRLKRLEDEVLGRRDKALNSTSDSTSTGGTRKPNKADEETARRMKQYNEKNRNKSLYDEHQGQDATREKKEKEEDDPSKRGFDREKDMALGGMLNHGERREMLAKAKDFGSRFQKGKYL